MHSHHHKVCCLVPITFSSVCKKCWFSWLRQYNTLIVPERHICCRRADAFLLLCICKVNMIAIWTHQNRLSWMVSTWTFCCVITAHLCCCMASLIARSACWANFSASAELSELLVMRCSCVTRTQTCLHVLLWLQHHMKKQSQGKFYNQQTAWAVQVKLSKSKVSQIIYWQNTEKLQTFVSEFGKQWQMNQCTHTGPYVIVTDAQDDSENVVQRKTSWCTQKERTSMPKQLNTQIQPIVHSSLTSWLQW